MIELSWPPKELSPNARVHFQAKAKATKLYREYCFWTAEKVGLPQMPAEGEIHLRIDFHPPDRRRRDLDNMLSSCKALIDAVADSLGVNDQRFSLSLHRGEPIKGGLVRVRVGQ